MKNGGVDERRTTSNRNLTLSRREFDRKPQSADRGSRGLLRKMPQRIVQSTFQAIPDKARSPQKGFSRSPAQSLFGAPRQRGRAKPAPIKIPWTIVLILLAGAGYKVSSTFLVFTLYGKLSAETELRPSIPAPSPFQVRPPLRQVATSASGPAPPPQRRPACGHVTFNKNGRARTAASRNPDWWLLRNKWRRG